MRQGGARVAINVVIDIHSGDTVADQPDLKRIADSGILGIIHKATEGVGWQDDAYWDRRSVWQANRGALWGAYHFGTHQHPGAEQAHAFLDFAEPTPETLIAIDFEVNEHAPANTMTLPQLREFVTTIHDQLNRWPVLYGGEHLRAQLGGAVDALLQNCPLWLSQYPSVDDAPLLLPPGWAAYTFWQYTNGHAGPPSLPRTVGGVPCDRNLFDGDSDALTRFWFAAVP
jgi:lysozyme